MTVVAHFSPGFSGGIGSAVAGLVALDDEVVHRLGPAADATLVQCHHALAWPDALAHARRLGVPAVKTVHVLQARQSTMRGVATATRSELMQARALAEADLVTIASHAARALLLEDHPALPAERVRMLPLASRLPTVGRSADAEAGPIIAVTRFDTLKGTELLQALVARLDHDVVIAGGLPDNPRAEARWLAGFAPSPRVRFAGWLEAPALAALYASARLFVTTSRLETCGLALIEALTAGCPAVTTNLPVHREAARAGTRFCEPSVAALSLAIAQAPAPGPIAPRRSASDAAIEWLHFWRQTR